MKHGKKLTSLLLALCMVLSIAAIGVVPGAAATTYTTYAQDTIQGSNILHCFNWSYNNIKAALPDIAAAGYTAVQTSPVQRPKDYNASYTTLGNEWWKMYQPLGFSIAANNTSWLGTKAQLTSLCTEADKYGIKVVVDVVANHLANNGTDGGTYSYINSAVESDLKNSNYYHTNNVKFNDNSRYNITQYHLGMPDLNTGNSYVQQRVQGLLEECIDCGVDGFRFDAAKHIETPSDSSSFASDFWPNVLNGATAYAQEKGVDAPFYYGEILGTPGPNFNISGYTDYMAVTDNASGDRALYQAYTGSASGLANGTYDKGAGAAKSVLWVESHDTYMGTSGSVSALRNTYDVTADVLTKAWAIVGARADATGLYFARPNTTMGNASTDTTWKSAAVTEINKFKNHFVGTSESLSYSGKTTYLERGTAGVVISKLDGEGAVSLTAKKMANGTYTDQLTGNTFTVSGGTISGTVGSTGIAVVYNAGATPTPSPTTAPSGTITVKFTDALGWGSANIYYWDNGPDWPGTAMTKAEVNDYGQQVYTATIPANVTGIVFNGGNSQTVDITTGIVNGAWWYTLDEKDNNSYKVGYVEPAVQPTVAPTEAPTSAPVTEPPVQTLAITNQPTDWTGNKGETATFTVAAVGQNLSYRWYYHPAGKTNWIDTGVTANTYSIAMSDVRNGRAIYCKVTDGAGNSVDSNVVTMSYPAVTGPVITKQPVDWAGQDGEQVNISVTAAGEGLSYRWFYWKAEKSKWIASPDTDASYDSITMESKFNGRRVYCKITDQEGNSVNSDEATITYAGGPVITKQPENWYGKNGAMTNITVIAEGEGLTYQWFYRPAGKTNWIATTDTDATYNIQMSSVRNGRQVYCKITDKNGVSVNSQVATMAYPA